MSVRHEDEPSAEELTRRLGGRWNARTGKGRALCLVHADTDPSVEIATKNGRTLVTCRVCGPGGQKALLSELRARGFWPERRAAPLNGARAPRRTERLGPVVAKYAYRDEHGSVLFWVYRHEPKTFRQHRPDGTPGIEGIRRVVYRLDEVTEAIGAGRTVFIPEGEKDVDSLWAVGVAATCNPMGQGKWLAEYGPMLDGADVVVLPDNDDVGRKHGQAVAASLAGHASRIRVLELPGLIEKGDVSDWLAAGGTVEDLLELAETAPEWKGEGTEAPPVSPLIAHSVWKILASPPEPREWHIPDWLPGDDVGGAFGDGGEGKTTLGLQLAWCTSVGFPWCGLTVRAGPAVYLSAEEAPRELGHRLHELAAGIVVPPDAMRHPFEVVSRAGEDALLCTFSRSGIIQPTPLYAELVHRIGDMKLTLVGIDAAADVFGGDENDRPQVRQFINLLRKPAIEHRCAILLMGHPSRDGLKTGLGYSGSTAWHNSIRARWYLTTPTTADEQEQDPNLRCLSLNKTNRGRRGQKIMLRWHSGWFAHEQGESSDVLKLAEAKTRFVEMLASYTGQGRALSDRSGPNYAPARFAEDPNGKRFTSAMYGKAMAALFAEKRLRVEAEGPPSRVRYRLVAA